MRLAVAINNRIILFQSKLLPLYWFPGMVNTDIIDGFVSLWELSLNEVPSSIKIVEGLDVSNYRASKTIVVRLKNRVELVNGETGINRSFYKLDGSYPMKEVFDLYEDQEMELLLCYGSKYIMQNTF